MSTCHMRHDVDPKHAILAAVGDLSHIRLLHNQVLVATYIRPKATKGGILLPDSTRQEDEYQGKVGLVLRKGPLAFQDDATNAFHGQDVYVGDWIAYRQSDGWQVVLRGDSAGTAAPESWRKGEYHCRMLQDIDIKAVLTTPDDLI